MLKLKDLEEEAVEVNRRYNNYLALKKLHRKTVIKLLDTSDDNREIKELARILMLTRGE